LKDVVRANKAGCLDHCALGPSVVIYPEGVWYSVKTESDVTEIMERHVLNGEVVTRLLMPDHPAPTRLSPLHSLR
jgi:(2Fe-2S) ferredoxin